MYATKALIKSLLCFLLTMLASVTALSATYGYSGPPYTTVGGIYTTNMRITGAFTTDSPLAPNLSNVEIGPNGLNLVVGWSFNNGVTTFTTGNSAPRIGVNFNGDFVVSTDVVGNITAFLIDLRTPPNPLKWADEVVTFIISTTPLRLFGTSPLQSITWNQPPCIGEIVCPGPGATASAQTAGSFITGRETAVPALSPGGVLLLLGLMAIAAAFYLRRKSG